ncbi:hypothetical protein GCM10020367_41790 [Streptomyces sannanensis]|uniref:Peptidoglycan binding domain-containing protein n=1 Tax=Streptomyces sannanensis TaxID=285536 RepID=A0ABP6SEW9_9ACTN
MYPSGTPPYGTRGDDTASVPDEPRTETTLTTRIRINIPGSRPIPPVVMRKPVAEADQADAANAPAGGEAAAERTDAHQRPAATETAAEPKPGETKTSDWFAPRKPTGPDAGASGAAPAAGAGGPRALGPGGGGAAGASDGTAGAPGVDAAAGGAAGPRVLGPGGRAPLPMRGAGAGAKGPGGVGAPASPYRGGPGAPAFPAAGGPAGPTSGPVTGNASMWPAGGATGRPGATAETSPMGPMSDDTAILTPQKPAPAGPAGGNVSGDTLTSGIPPVPADQRAPFPPGPNLTPRLQDAPDHTSPAPAPAAASEAPAKKGRSKLVLAGAGVVGLVGVAYAAGLLLNHSEVPKGTTVLGVDIGGGTKEEAVSKLDSAFGDRATAPIQLNVDGKKAELKPEQAGLTLDSQATVRAAAGPDYNPVSVIGSLFGGERVAQPVIPVDEEKLSVALGDLAGTSGTATEGTIKFLPGKAVAVPGKAGKTLDVGKSMISVRDAYRTQVETGSADTVDLPVTTRQPAIDQAELDRAMNSFAKPAMSGLITIKAGGKQIQFGPARSLPKILSMKPIDGKLVEVYDKQAITELLDGVFDGITITKGDGQQHPLSADDVAHAMQKALLGKTPAERTEVIELNPS